MKSDTHNFVIETGHLTPCLNPSRFFFSDGRPAPFDGYTVQVRLMDGECIELVCEEGGSTSYSIAARSPISDSILVIATGTGYLISTRNPNEFEILPVPDIVGMLQCSLGNSLIVYGFTDLAIIGSNGIRMSSERLAYDGLEGLACDGRRITGMGWSAPLEQWQPIEVEMETGLVIRSAYS